VTTILAVDTTSEFGSIALRRDGNIIAETPLHSPDGFSHVIFGEIDRLLKRAGVTLADIDCFASASGPGSFTGVRVGLTVVKGLAEAMAKPVAAVSNLRALAALGSSGRRAVILDARRGDVYAAVYNAELDPILPETVIKLPAWLAALGDVPYEFITLAGSPFRSALAESPFSAMLLTDASRLLAPSIARCAELDLDRGLALSPVAADANYVRSSDAELFWEAKNK
jgi:tRNA threonylcarbamoyladenosine biosynthesis protein TsaB